MIKIKRANKPDVLNRAKLSDKAYRNEPIPKVLYEMQNEKCCYCERRIPNKGLGKHVEHFKPRDLFEELTNEWNNLFLACPQCNGNKSNKFPVLVEDKNGNEEVKDYSDYPEGKPLLIDPSYEHYNPSDHFELGLDDQNFGQILSLSIEGKATIDTIDLNEEFYVSVRLDWLGLMIFFHEKLMEEYERHEELAGSIFYSNDVLKFQENFLRPKKPFLCLAQFFVKACRLDDYFQLDILDNDERFDK